MAGLHAVYQVAPFAGNGDFGNYDPFTLFRPDVLGEMTYLR